MNEQLDIERAERDGCRFFYGGEWNDGVFVGWAECRGATMAVVKYRESGGMVVVVPVDVLNIPPATPSPVEHTVAAGGPRPVPGERMHYCCGVLIHTADGIPVAYTKDGVRVEVAMVGDWTCAACQFTISGVHQIVTDDGPTDEWQIPPCEHCAAAALPAALNALDGEATDG